MRQAGLSRAVAAKVFVAVVGEMLPRPCGELAGLTISSLVRWDGFLNVEGNAAARQRWSGGYSGALVATMYY